MYNDPFTKILPSLDVHGHTRDTVVLAVSEFINDNIKMGKYMLVIVHGLGLGILKKTINTSFRRDKRVKSLAGDCFNLGITIIELNK